MYRQSRWTSIIFLAVLSAMVNACSAPQVTPRVLPTATPEPPPTATFVPSPTPTFMPIPSSTAIGEAPGPTATPVLPKLSVFDAGGDKDKIEVKIYGTDVAHTALMFRVKACVPNCQNIPDGKGVDKVEFTFEKCPGTKRCDVEQGQEVYRHTERAAPYCSFGGSGVCDWWVFAERKQRWPNNNPIEDGIFVLTVNVTGKENWNGKVNFRIAR